MFEEARLAEDKVAGFLEEEGAELVAEDGDLVGVDLVVCLGGDGTLLKVCNYMYFNFKGMNIEKLSGGGGLFFI